MQICQWSGIPRLGITGTCSRPATLTGCNLTGAEQHLCTQHMQQRAKLGYEYTYVWPCQLNGYSYRGASKLPDGARAYVDRLVGAR